VEQQDLNVDVPDDPADFVTTRLAATDRDSTCFLNALDAVEQGGLVALTAQSQDDHVLITVRTREPASHPRIAANLRAFYTTKGRGKGTDWAWPSAANGQSVWAAPLRCRARRPRLAFHPAFAPHAQGRTSIPRAGGRKHA